MLNDIKSIVINIKENVYDILFPQSLLMNTLFISKTHDSYSRISRR